MGDMNVGKLKATAELDLSNWSGNVRAVKGDVKSISSEMSGTLTQAIESCVEAFDEVAVAGKQSTAQLVAGTEATQGMSQASASLAEESREVASGLNRASNALRSDAAATKGAQRETVTLKDKLKELNSEFGKRSTLGMLGKIAIGGGAIGGINLILGQLDEFSKGITHAFTELRTGAKDAGEVADELARSLPLLGHIYSAGRNIHELITGAEAETSRLNELEKAIAASLEDQRQILRSVGSSHKENLETVRKIRQEMQLIGAIGPERQRIEIEQADADARKAIQDKAAADRAAAKVQRDKAKDGLDPQIKAAQAAMGDTTVEYAQWAQKKGFKLTKQEQAALDFDRLNHEKSLADNTLKSANAKADEDEKAGLGELDKLKQKKLEQADTELAESRRKRRLQSERESARALAQLQADELRRNGRELEAKQVEVQSELDDRLKEIEEERRDRLREDGANYGQIMQEENNKIAIARAQAIEKGLAASQTDNDRRHTMTVEGEQKITDANAAAEENRLKAHGQAFEAAQAELKSQFAKRIKEIDEEARKESLANAADAPAIMARAKQQKEAEREAYEAAVAENVRHHGEQLDREREEKARKEEEANKKTIESQRRLSKAQSEALVASLRAQGRDLEAQLEELRQKWQDRMDEATSDAERQADRAAYEAEKAKLETDDAEKQSSGGRGSRGSGRRPSPTRRTRSPVSDDASDAILRRRRSEGLDPRGPSPERIKDIVNEQRAFVGDNIFAVDRFNERGGSFDEIAQRVNRSGAAAVDRGRDAGASRGGFTVQSPDVPVGELAKAIGAEVQPRIDRSIDRAAAATRASNHVSTVQGAL